MRRQPRPARKPCGAFPLIRNAARKPCGAFRLVRNAAGNPDRRASPVAPSPSSATRRAIPPDAQAPSRLQPSFTKRRPTRKPASLPALVRNAAHKPCGAFPLIRNAAGNPGRHASPPRLQPSFTKRRPTRKPASLPALIRNAATAVKRRDPARALRRSGRQAASPPRPAVAGKTCGGISGKIRRLHRPRICRRNAATPLFGGKQQTHLKRRPNRKNGRPARDRAAQNGLIPGGSPHSRQGNQPHAARGVGAPGAVRAFCTAHRRPLIALKALARTALCRTGPSHRGRRRPRRLAPTVTRRRERLEMPPHRH